MEAFILIFVLSIVLIAINVVLDKMVKLHSEQKKLDEHEPHESGYQDDTKDI